MRKIIAGELNWGVFLHILIIRFLSGVLKWVYYLVKCVRFVSVFCFLTSKTLRNTHTKMRSTPYIKRHFTYNFCILVSINQQNLLWNLENFISSSFKDTPKNLNEGELDFPYDEEKNQNWQTFKEQIDTMHSKLLLQTFI